MAQQKTWKTEPWVDIPTQVIQVMSDMKTEEVTEGTKSFTFEGEKIEIFYREVTPKEIKIKIPVLFLHGRAFTSQNWQDIGTLQLLGAIGCHVVAVDLPGYGKSSGSVGDREIFLATLIRQHNLDRPIIVSPSMSGIFSLPYIMNNPSTALERVQGFVPVAPVGTGEYMGKYKMCMVPSMITYGSRDTNLGSVSKAHLRNLPNSELCQIDDAGHAAYMNKPDEWHKALYNFILAIQRVNVSDN